jgi:hypothetical protein
MLDPVLRNGIIFGKSEFFFSKEDNSVIMGVPTCRHPRG